MKGFPHIKNPLYKLHIVTLRQTKKPSPKDKFLFNPSLPNNNNPHIPVTKQLLPVSNLQHANPSPTLYLYEFHHFYSYKIPGSHSRDTTNMLYQPVMKLKSRQLATTVTQPKGMPVKSQFWTNVSTCTF